MSEVGACDQCLRRGWLLASLSEPIEAVAAGLPGARSRELLALSDSDLCAAVAGNPRADRMLQRSRERDPSRLREAVRGAGSWACCRHDPRYPPGVPELRDSPALLFGRGDPVRLDWLRETSAVTVVGSRRPSAYGREMASRLGRELASAGVTVVSGMALGIDSCAHRGALDAGGRTIAVLGSGPDVPHPAGMRRLYESIVERGIVLAELPPGTRPRRWTFPARNRIMAALGGMTVVVEGRARSGSLITAAMASDLGREVGAVPGRVGTSQADGPNDLLRDGAHVVRDGQDALDSLLGPGALSVGGGPAAAGQLDTELGAVLEAVEGGGETQDAVARASGLDAGAVAAALTTLELAGLIACDGVGRYRGTTLRG